MERLERETGFEPAKYAGVGVATGISVGVVIVAATDDMGVWLAIGIMDSRHPILQTASDLIAIERPLSPAEAAVGLRSNRVAV